MEDKSEIMLNYIQTCPYINAHTLFFNFGDIENDAHQMITKSDDVAVQRPYIDGSVLKRYTFSIDCFKTVAFNPVIQDYSDANLDDFQEAQKLLDWVTEQNDEGNYPIFENCIIDEMKSLTTKPDMLVVNTSVTPPVAIYRITIQIDYLDNSKRVY